MVVMVALLPQLIVGLRSTDSANSITESKGLAQSELERMRNPPYHVAPAAGNYVDVLDRYYPNLGTPSREAACADPTRITRSEEHTSELQSLMRNSYAVFCLQKKLHSTETNT